jgi:tight adherence protein C
MLLALFGAVAAFIAVSSGLLWVVNLRGSPAEARLSRIAVPSRPRNVNAPFSERVAIPLIDNVTRVFVQALPQTWVARASKALKAAGRPMTTQAFFSVLLITAVGCPGAMFALIMMSQGALSTPAMLLVATAATAGVLLPVLWLRRAASARKLAIWKRLADAFDLVTVCVEAGLGLDAALRHVSEKLRGPLAEEIAQVLREVGMGRPRREALEDMAHRCDIRELDTFVNAVIQAETLGSSLGRVLRAQAFSLRVRRRQRAQETARKAPVKMVFPLVLLIMPTFFIITVGPVLVHLITYLSE